MFNKSELKAIVVDLGNVLIDVRYQICIDKLRHYKENIDILFEMFFKYNINLMHKLEMGIITGDEFLNEVKKHLNVEIDNKELAKIISEIFIENTVLTQKLPELKSKYKIYLFSNTSSIHRDYGWGNYDFLKYFDKLFLSYETGLLKPYYQFYDYVERNIGLKKSEFIYTDDLEENIQTALRRGWNAVQFKDTDEFLKLVL